MAGLIKAGADPKMAWQGRTLVAHAQRWGHTSRAWNEVLQGATSVVAWESEEIAQTPSVHYGMRAAAPPQPELHEAQELSNTREPPEQPGLRHSAASSFDVPPVEHVDDLAGAAWADDDDDLLR